MKNWSLLIVYFAFLQICTAQQGILSSASTVMDSKINNHQKYKGAFEEFVVESEANTFSADLMDAETSKKNFQSSLKQNKKFINTTEAIIDLNYKRKAKPFDVNFTGYTIQVMTSERALSKNHPLFIRFGGVKVQENLEPKYAYFLGDFNTIEGAQDFVNKIIGTHYPNAKVVAFKKGKRVQ